MKFSFKQELVWPLLWSSANNRVKSSFNSSQNLIKESVVYPSSFKDLGTMQFNLLNSFPCFSVLFFSFLFFSFFLNQQTMPLYSSSSFTSFNGRQIQPSQMICLLTENCFAISTHSDNCIRSFIRMCAMIMGLFI